MNIELYGNKHNDENGAKLRSGKGKIPIIIAIVAGALVILIAAGFAAMGVYAQNIDTAYPNVTVSGISVGGKTVGEVYTALDEAGYLSSYQGTSVTVVLPGDEELTVTAEDAGLVTSTEDTAEAVVHYGKEGSFINNTFGYLKCLLSGVEILSDDAFQINEEAVRALIANKTEELYNSVLQEAYVIKDDQIYIIKGHESIVIDEDEVYDLIYSAFLNENFDDITYKPQSDEPSTIDLQAIYDAVFVEPVDAVYDEETMNVSEDAVGVRFDLSAARMQYNAAGNGDTIVIPMIYTEPSVTTESLSNLLFRDVLSEKSTSLSGSSSNRINNITLAAAAINGTILNPGETFSYNGTVGERTSAKGYRPAGAYVGGKIVQEVGGGICQVSSTLYCCVLYADLEVVDRSNHMFTVGYLPLGLDATVNWGTVDFKFANDSDYPIKVVSYVSGSHLTMQIVGTKLDDSYVETKYVLISSTPYQIVEQEDESIPEGETKVETSGHTGYVVDTYKYFYDGEGDLLSKTLVARSTYRKQDRVILIPVSTSPSPDVSPSPDPSSSGSPPVTESPPVTPTATPSVTPTETPSASPSAST